MRFPIGDEVIYEGLTYFVAERRNNNELKEVRLVGFSCYIDCWDVGIWVSEEFVVLKGECPEEKQV